MIAAASPSTSVIHGAPRRAITLMHALGACDTHAAPHRIPSSPPTPPALASGSAMILAWCPELETCCPAPSSKTRMSGVFEPVLWPTVICAPLSGILPAAPPARGTSHASSSGTTTTSCTSRS